MAIHWLGVTDTRWIAAPCGLAMTVGGGTGIADLAAGHLTVSPYKGIALFEGMLECSDVAIHGLGVTGTRWIAAPYGLAMTVGGGTGIADRRWPSQRLTTPRHCEERSDVAIHGLAVTGTHWIAAPLRGSQ